jgi:hypothetical protein
MPGQLGPHARRLSDRQDVAPGAKVDVIVTATGAPDSKTLLELEALGLNVSTAAGRILVGDIAVGRLAEVAAASVVRYLEVASSVWVDTAGTGT